MYVIRLVENYQNTIDRLTKLLQEKSASAEEYENMVEEKKMVRLPVEQHWLEIRRLLVDGLGGAGVGAREGGNAREAQDQ